jgi:hypothetical protein
MEDEEEQQQTNVDFNLDMSQRIDLLKRKLHEQSLDKNRGVVKVSSRCVFERIIDIDTKGEKYDADVIIESSWFNDDILQVLLSPNFDPEYRIFS